MLRKGCCCIRRGRLLTYLQPVLQGIHHLPEGGVVRTREALPQPASEGGRVAAEHALHALPLPAVKLVYNTHHPHHTDGRLQAGGAQQAGLRVLTIPVQRDK